MKTNLRTSLLVAVFCALLCTVATWPVAAQQTALTPSSAFAAYCQAWGTADRAARDRLLAQVWAPDGVYIDPEPTVAEGRKGLSDAIEIFLRSYPGGHFRCSTPQVHHRFMRVAWVRLGPDGTQRAQGTDFGELAADGRIRRIVGFFGPPPKVPRESP